MDEQPGGAGGGKRNASSRAVQRLTADADRGAKGAAGSGTPVAVYAGLGVQFALSILVFLFLGQWLDRKLGTSPLLLILGVFLGAAAGFYSMYRRLMADQRREESLRKK